MNTRSMAFVAVSAAIIGVLAQVTVPMPSGVPITLQTLGVALVGFVLGVRRGAVACGLYIAMGAVGMPVFSGFRGGVTELLSPTGGFIFGFLLLCVACGVRAEGRINTWVVPAAGLLACHLLGVLWFWFVTDTGIGVAAITVSLPYIIKDAVSIAVARVAAKRLKRVVRI